MASHAAPRPVAASSNRDAASPHPATAALLAAFRLAVDEAPEAERIAVAKLHWQDLLRRVLPADRPRPPQDGAGADRRRPAVRRRREGAAVDHRVADLDARRDAAEQEPPDAAFERAERLSVRLEVGLGAVDRRRELAVEAREQVREAVGVADDEGDGAEHLLSEVRGLAERIGVDVEHGRAAGGGSSTLGVGAGVEANARGGGEAGEPASVRLGDAGRQHRRRGRRGEALGQRGDERIAGVAPRHEGEAGVGAELPRAERHRSGEPLGERLGPLGQRARKHDERVDAPHLGIDGDRHGPRRRLGDEREAGPLRPREADCPNAWVPNEREPDLDASVEQQREDALGQALRRDGLLNHVPDEQRRARMCRVRLDHHRAARREGRRRVAAGDGEGEREVARPEHGDGPERTQHRPQIRLRRGRPVRVGRVESGVDPRAVLGEGGEEAELARGATRLAAEACLGECRLAVRAPDDLVHGHLEAVRDAAQEGRALRAGRAPVRTCGSGREAHGAVHVAVRCGEDVAGERLARRRVDGVERVGHGVGRRGADEGESGHPSVGCVSRAWRMTASAASRSGPTTSRRGGRTRSEPISTFSWTSLMSCTNVGTTSRRKSGRNQA